MNRSELEQALRVAGEIAQDREFIVFGSQAILGLVVRPPKRCLASMEVDIYPKNNHRAVLLLVTKLGNRSAFARRSGFFIDCVSPDLATLPDGWTERLVPFCTKKTGGVTGWCLEIHDLVVSKLAAGRAKDLEYIHALHHAKLIEPPALENRIKNTPVPAKEKQIMRMRLKNLLRPISTMRPGRRKRKK